jgi:hypothetical protein
LKSEQGQLALALGCLAAVLWGAAVSLRAFWLGPLAIEWSEWALQFFVGIAVCLVGSIVTLLVTEKVRARSRLAAVRLQNPRR